jgi:tRNA/tmRNA/rRNA uracil-C5-methylase (TrmA/RlmC/RlmD family)
MHLYCFACILFSADHRCTGEQNPFELIHGDEFIYEIYHGKKFRISPQSFFQVNKKSAESVYSTTLEHAQIDENTVVLDIGSGIGKDQKLFTLEII